MKTRLRQVIILTLACLIVSSLLWVSPLGVQHVSATPDKAAIGGFLLPFSNVGQFDLGPLGYLDISDDGRIRTHAGIEAYDFVQHNQNEVVALLAPKSGVVLDARDELDYVTYSVDDGACVRGNSNTMNYILLGHGG